MIILCIEDTPIFPVSDISFWTVFKMSASDCKSARVALEVPLSSDSVSCDVRSREVSFFDIGVSKYFFFASVASSQAF